ncbi:MAG: ribonuclease H-like domain-containing protein [Candidatus Limnocylindrales bacterium]
MGEAAVLARRLVRLRAERDEGAAAIRTAVTDLWREPVPAPPALPVAGLAERLAAAVDGDVIRGDAGCYVRCEPPSLVLPLDRERLARLPAGARPDVPLVCLDTETTGLGSAAGTMAFLVGLGWWEGDRFRQVGLLLPDQSEEGVLLAALRAALPAEAWLVTYNGRSFDWPLLVTRFRLTGSSAPTHAGHIDLLPVVRRLFRHRLPDARLGTVEREMLGVRRGRDVEGWQIPDLYLRFLRGGPAAPLLDVVRHNEEDVRSLARLLAHLEGYADETGRRAAPPGDLAGLARAYRAAGRHEEALDCLDFAIEGLATAGPPPAPRWGSEALPWGARPWDRPLAHPPLGPAQLQVERARLLRRLGRHDAALAAWDGLARAGGPDVVHAWIELAKLAEHHRRDIAAALAAADGADRALARSRLAGRPVPRLEADLAHRRARLRRRLGSISRSDAAGRPTRRRRKGSRAVDAQPPDPARRSRAKAAWRAGGWTGWWGRPAGSQMISGQGPDHARGRRSGSRRSAVRSRRHRARRSPPPPPQRER